MSDPVTGPIPRAEFRALIDAPFGEAVKAIRKYDPLYGLEKGKKITWRVSCRRDRVEGTAFVEAASQKEAEALADELSSCEVDWDDDDDFTITSIKPEPERSA